jgi:hypothetical protein
MWQVGPGLLDCGIEYMWGLKMSKGLKNCMWGFKMSLKFLNNVHMEKKYCMWGFKMSLKFLNNFHMEKCSLRSK